MRNKRGVYSATLYAEVLTNLADCKIILISTEIQWNPIMKLFFAEKFDLIQRFSVVSSPKAMAVGLNFCNVY